MPDYKSDTSLSAAVKTKNWELVPLIIQRGADVNFCDETNQLPLHSAAFHNAPADIITKLISPENINMPNSRGGTVLHIIVSQQRWELVPLLLQHGADLTCGDRIHQTSLHLAIQCNAPANIITQLISPQSINMQDDLHKTALQLLIRYGKWELVPVLLQHGADVNLCEIGKQTPLHCAIRFNAPVSIVTQLISPQNINMQDCDGLTAVHKALSLRMWEMVPVLLQYGTDPIKLGSIQPDLVMVNVHSLRLLCITTIRNHMPVKSDEAYEGLGLPKSMLPEVKLRPLAEKMVHIAKTLCSS